MKKLALILLAFVMILSLAACAGGNEPSGNSSNTDPSQNVTDNNQTEGDAGGPSETGNENEQPYTNEDLYYGNSKSRSSVIPFGLRTTI